MNPPIQLMGLTAFDEVERKPNLVALCKVMFWKTHIPTFPHSHIPTFAHSHILTFSHSHIPLRMQKWPPRLGFAGACHGK